MLHLYTAKSMRSSKALACKVCVSMGCHDTRVVKRYRAIWQHASRGDKSMQAHASKVTHRMSGEDADVNDKLM